MDNYPPNIEILPNTHSLPPYTHKKPWYKSYRLAIFSITFLVTVTGSLFYSYSRPAIFRSTATLLTSAMTAIDQDSAKADSQHVAIQRQILLGQELLTETLLQINSLPSHENSQVSITDLQNFLQVEPVSDTNLVEIRAEGTDPSFLPVLINTWIDVYLNAREQEVTQLTDNTTHLIEDELKGLEAKVNAKRLELETFRKVNDILSTGRDENEALARLKGITESLNKASEEEVKAKANLDAIKLAIAEGQPVVPEQDQGILQNLEKRRQELKEKQAKLQRQFTQDYIDLQPSMKIIPEEIEKIELEILRKLDYGKNIVLTVAQKDYAAAQQTVKNIRVQLENHKKQASAFTTQFTKHETLKTDLEGLEKLYRATQERLVQIQANHKEKYPQVTVINRANQPDTPLRPDYRRDAIIAVAGSLFLSVFAVWLVDFLGKKQEPPAAVTLSGIHMYQANAGLPNYQANTSNPTLEHQANNMLTSPTARELSSYELKLLLENANLKGKQLVACLLSGLTPIETASLHPEQIDLNANKIIINEPHPRSLPLHSPVKNLLAQSNGQPVWDGNSANTTSELNATLLCAAIDSGLPHPAEISPEAIRHSYIAYLVRQGLRLSDLETIVGYLEPPQMLSYTTYSPPQRGLTVNEIQLLHPALQGIA